MNPERWQELERLFDQALASEDRESFLDSIKDEDLAGEVRTLLDAHGSRHELLDAPGLELAAAGTRLGPYVIEREIGSGGMGTVYLGRRADEQFDKTVAIKLLHGSRLAAGMFQRFRREQQILAQLEHPYIARILDAGVSGGGVPYLVMEFVDGKNLAIYAAEKQLSIPDRLALFGRICEAVQYAHQNLVIHRDVKPGNILITADGSPKLLDFGTAKLLEPENTESDSTQTHVTLTPKYASPEQVRRAPVSMASDIYSLGVVLYELLTGRLPYPDDHLSAPRIYQAILDYDPPLASRTGAATRGDIDCILAKALRKDPKQRYASVQQFHDDLERHRRGLPVLAQPDSFAYRARKFARRNWVAVSAAAAIATAMALGTGIAVWQARIAQSARLNAEAVNEFLLEIITNANPDRTGALAGKGGDLRLVDLLDESAGRVGKKFIGAPDIEISVRGELAGAYGGINQFSKAHEQAEIALGLARSRFGESSVQAAHCYYQLGRIGVSETKYADAERSLRKALEFVERSRLDDDFAKSVRNSLGLALANLGKRDEALRQYMKAYESVQRVLGGSSLDAATACNNIAALYYELNDRPKFREWIERSVATFRKMPEPPMAFGSALNNLAQVEFQDQNYTKAIATMDEAVAFWRKFFGADKHGNLAIALANDAIMRTRAGQAASAVPLAEEALTLYQRSYEAEGIAVAHGLDAVGRAQCGAGNFAAGTAALQHALVIRKKTQPAGDTQLGSTSFQLGKCLLAAGRARESEHFILDGYAIRKARFGDKDPARAEIAETLEGLRKAISGLKKD